MLLFKRSGYKGDKQNDCKCHCDEYFQAYHAPSSLNII